MRYRNDDIPDVKIISNKIFQDDRGFFLESYNQSYFNDHGINNSFVQDNVSFSKKGTIRGLHFQNEPMTQAKLVRVLKGKVFDVFVDIRKDSPTFRKCSSIILSEEHNIAVYIPRGFAHGFMALEDSIFMYKVDNYYSKKCENSILWNDSNLSIQWPGLNTIFISDKDKQAQTFKNYLKSL